MDDEERKRLIKAQLEKKTEVKSSSVLNTIFLVLAGTLVFGACSAGLYYTVSYMY